MANSYKWTGLRLFKNGKIPVAELQGRGASDDYRGLFSFRLLPDGEISDIYNFTRARENAVVAARAKFDSRPEKNTGAPPQRKPTVRVLNSPASPLPAHKKVLRK